MIELIRTLVEIMVQALPRLKTVRNEKLHHELGVELFILYTQLNETTLIAESIIDSLERYTHKMADEDDGNPNDPDTTTLVAALKAQHHNLQNILDSLESNATVLQIIDSASFNRLFRPLRQKEISLRDVLRRPMLRSEFSHPLLMMKLERLPLDPPHKYKFTESHVFARDPWGPEVYLKISQYLREYRPRKRLSEISDALTGMRASLEEYFSVAEILPEVRRKHIFLDKFHPDFSSKQSDADSP